MQATERFEAVYPTLRAVALAGSTGSKAMKQVSLQILSFAIKAAGESIGLNCFSYVFFSWSYLCMEIDIEGGSNCFEQATQSYPRKQLVFVSGV